MVEEVMPKPKYKYLCPACTDTAIETSNRMTGIKIDCQTCGKLIELVDMTRYIKL